MINNGDLTANIVGSKKDIPKLENDRSKKDYSSMNRQMKVDEIGLKDIPKNRKQGSDYNHSQFKNKNPNVFKKGQF